MSSPHAVDIPVPEPDLTGEQMVGRAREMIPALRERRAETERLGRLPDDTVREFVDAGFYRILQPRRFGGYEFPLPIFTRVALELSRGCPSSGWAYTLTAGHGHVLAVLFGEECQVDVAGADGDIRMPGRIRPGIIHDEDGGYRVSGAFDYVSGCDSATHLILGFMREGGDSRQGELATEMVGIVDRADVEIVDNWDVLGMRGTGSKRVVVDEVFLPAHRMIRFDPSPDAEPTPGRAVHDAPIYRQGPIGSLLFSETAAVAIGAARGMLDLYEESIRTRRTSVLPLVPMTEHPQYPRFYGDALQLIEVAESALLHSDEQYMEWSRLAEETDFEFTMERDALLQLRKQYCAKLADDAVHLMLRTNGSAGMRTGSDWQRYVRDFAVLMTHNTLQPELSANAYGRTHFSLLPADGRGPVPQVR
jgi:3-hydroxy-9,10-secoandrosta-1,3,5(10)-triene-9,17-dione monooxygenase